MWQNTVALALAIIGVATIGLGIIAGIVLITTLTTPIPGYTYLTTPHPLRWTYGILVMLSSIVSGIIFIGFAEIINLLTRLNSHFVERDKQVSTNNNLSETVAPVLDKEEQPALNN